MRVVFVFIHASTILHCLNNRNVHACLNTDCRKIWHTETHSIQDSVARVRPPSPPSMLTHTASPPHFLV